MIVGTYIVIYCFACIMQLSSILLDTFNKLNDRGEQLNELEQIAGK